MDAGSHDIFENQDYDSEEDRAAEEMETVGFLSAEADGLVHKNGLHKNSPGHRLHTDARSGSQ